LERVKNEGQFRRGVDMVWWETERLDIPMPPWEPWNGNDEA